jgi:hypothetical protein
MQKLLVIDKSCFQGIPESLFIKFAQNYNTVLPHTLFVECLISEDVNGSRTARDPIVLLDRIDNALKSGANAGKSSLKLFKQEQKILKPVDSVIDIEGTILFRKGVLKVDKTYAEKEAIYCRNTFIPNVKTLFNIGKTYFENIEKKGFENQFRNEFQEVELFERLVKWLQVVEKMREAIVERSFSKDISQNLSNDWFTWHMARLYWCWGIEWACRRSCSGPSLEQGDISNDLYDIEYVAYLSRADGILTRDQKLVKPLAKAAFPEKDVFSRLDEVPDEYLCHWS